MNPISFLILVLVGITIWEIITGELPYRNMDMLKAAIEVAQEGLRPEIPVDTPKDLAELMERCWIHEPESRPTFKDIVAIFYTPSEDRDEEGNITVTEDENMIPGEIFYSPISKV